MKKVLILTLLGTIALFVTTTTTSCKTKEGCGLEEKYSAPVNNDGSLSTKRGKSNLFSKKQRKKMKKRGQGK
jgi:hypothetical protein